MDKTQNQTSGPCSYCGQETTHTDAYGMCCEYCDAFWDTHPTPPVPPPDGVIQVNLTTQEIEVKRRG